MQENDTLEFGTFTSTDSSDLLGNSGSLGSAYRYGTTTTPPAESHCVNPVAALPMTDTLTP